MGMLTKIWWGFGEIEWKKVGIWGLGTPPHTPHLKVTKINIQCRIELRSQSGLPYKKINYQGVIGRKDISNCTCKSAIYCLLAKAFLSRSYLSGSFSDTVLPLRKLLCIAIPAGIKHVACRYWDLGGCRCRRLQHEVLRERLRDTVYQNCDYRHAMCLIPAGIAIHRRILRGRIASYKPSERGLVFTNASDHLFFMDQTFCQIKSSLFL